jgi:dUTPase
VIAPFSRATWAATDRLPTSERDGSGFGSTGVSGESTG